VSISAKIIADSRCFITGKRITTMQLRYPRIIHAEFMTHRVFSRNASSSRAVPVAKLIEEARNETAMPVRFGANKPGMQDKGQEHDAPIYGFLTECDDHGSYPAGISAADAWKLAAESAATVAEAFDAAGYHKQIANRLLEPFTHINVVVTATNWANFYGLRCHTDADPTMKALADTMWEAQQASTPVPLTRYDWHLPYITDRDLETLSTEQLLIASAARCARVSYNKHDGSFPSFEDDLALYEKLVTAELVHASPLEHQAKPDPDQFWRELWGNFDGFTQFRKTISNEAIYDVH
jgi:thymidylate synthase ThyX